MAGEPVARYVDVEPELCTSLALSDKRPFSARSGIVVGVATTLRWPMVADGTVGTLPPKLSDGRWTGGASPPLVTVLETTRY